MKYQRLKLSAMTTCIASGSGARQLPMVEFLLRVSHNGFANRTAAWSEWSVVRPRMRSETLSAGVANSTSKDSVCTSKSRTSPIRGKGTSQRCPHGVGRPRLADVSGSAVSAGYSLPGWVAGRGGVTAPRVGRLPARCLEPPCRHDATAHWSMPDAWREERGLILGWRLTSLWRAWASVGHVWIRIRLALRGTF